MEPAPLPSHWVGMFVGYKRDAMYYERCVKDIRDIMRDVTSQYANKDMKLILIESMLSDILSHEYELEGVDTDKPNYGMFE